MFYRLPLLFSASYYIILLSAQVLSLFFGRKFINDTTAQRNTITKMALYDLTSFFFVLILSCFFFYQNKLYFYIARNKSRIRILALVFALIYLFTECVLSYLIKIIFMSNFVKLGEQSSNYHQVDQIPIVNSLIEILTNIWLYIISGIVLYILVKLSRRFFQTPLIDSFAQSHQQKLPSSSNQLNSNMTQQDSSKFYAIIFASIFCFVSNGAMWNIYFRIFSSVYEINVLLNEYDNMIFLFGFASVIFSYVFLYCISQKFILKTYSWLPISSLLTASTITLILFGISSLMISCFMLPFVFAFHSIILLLLWFIVCYAVLYCLTRFALRRYFA